MLKKNYNRYWILFAVEFVIMVLLLCACFRKEQLVSEFSGADMQRLATQEENVITFESHRMVLEPGVYQIRPQVTLDKGQYVYVEMLYEKAHFHSLRTNEVELDAESKEAAVEVYVTDKVPSAFVRCQFVGADASVLNNLQIYKTNLGNRMLFVLALMAMTVLDGMLIWRRRILEGKVSGRQQIVFWGLVATVLLAYFPYLTDYIIVGAKTLHYCAKIADFTLGFPVMTALKFLVFVITVLTAAGAYVFLKRSSKDEYVALFGTTIYLVNPWRLKMVYAQGALDKCLVWMLLPFVLWSVFMVGARFAKLSVKRKEEVVKRVRQVVGIVALFAVIAAVYQVNRIAFESEAVYLYADEALTSIDCGRAVSGISSAYKLYIRWGYMIGIQLGTALTAWIFFRRIFVEKQDKLAVAAGVLLYLLCPYRIYVCYELADLSQAVFWMLLPVYGFAIYGVVQGEYRLRDIILGAITLAAMSYADVVQFVIVLGVTMLMSVLGRRLVLLLPAAGGAVLSVMQLYKLVSYLFRGQEIGQEVALTVIMDKGYRIGELLGVYVHQEEHPGMGLLLLVCLVAGLWLSFVKGVKEEAKLPKLLTGVAAFFMLLSLRYFPWDIVQRLGVWALRFVSLMETPGVLAGLAYACLCIPGAYAVKRMYGYSIYS